MWRGPNPTCKGNPKDFMKPPRTLSSQWPFCFITTEKFFSLFCRTREWLKWKEEKKKTTHLVASNLEDSRHLAYLGCSGEGQSCQGCSENTDLPTPSHRVFVSPDSWDKPSKHNLYKSNDIFFNWLILEKLRGDRSICCSTHSCIHWLFVTWPGIEPTTLVDWDDAPTHWITRMVPVWGQEGKYTVLCPQHHFSKLATVLQLSNVYVNQESVGGPDTEHAVHDSGQSGYVQCRGPSSQMHDLDSKG